MRVPECIQIFINFLQNKNLKQMKKISLFTLVFLSILNFNFSQDFWKSLDSPNGVEINQIGIDLFGNYYIAVQGKHQIFRSVDNCQTWESFDEGLAETYILGKKFVNAPDSSLYLLTSRDVFVLRPHYNRWKKINLNEYEYGFNDISVNPQGDIYIVGSLKIYRSTNNGASFRPINIVPAFNSQICANGKGKNFVISEDENHEDVVYIFNDDGSVYEKKSFPTDMPWADGILYDSIENRLFIYGWHDGYFSDDDGLTWTKLQIGEQHNSIYYLTMSPAGDLFCDCWKGIFKSIDSGNTWSKINNAENFFSSGILSLVFINAEEIFVLPKYWGSNLTFELGLTDTNFEDFQKITTGIKQARINEISKDKNGVMFVNISYNKWLISFDDCQTWDTLNLPDTNEYFHYIEHDQNGNIYGLSSNRSLYISTDYGSTWSDITPEEIENVYFEGIHVNPAGKIYIYGSGNLYISNDYGENWNTFMTQNLIPFNAKWFFHSDGTIYSYDIFETYFSKDDGVSWSRMFDSYTNIYAFHIAKNGDILIVRDDYDSFGASLFKYENGELIKLKDNTFSNSIESNIDGDIFIETQDRILRSVDNGNSWEDITYNLDNPNYLTLYVDNNQFLYTYSKYDVIYKSKFSTTQNHSILGYVFLDENKNCIKDAEENGIQDWELKLSGTIERNITTDERGEFSTNLTDGSYTFKLIVPDDEKWKTCQIDTAIVFDSEQKDTTVVMFLIQKKDGTSTFEVESSTSDVIVYPQPFSNKTNIVIKNNKVPENSEFRVYNRLGKLVHFEKIHSNNIIFNNNELPSGLYLFKVIFNNKIISSGKLIIQ